ncbi:sulfatase-like hydrolase/transferase, partial [bacterium]|nr:sulfatase-like hydrolase/transferase [bacterium]
MKPKIQTYSSPAFFFGLQCLTLFLLSVELVRLTSPKEFFWVQFSPYWMEGTHFLGLIFGVFACITFLGSRMAITLSQTAPPIAIVLGILLNLAILKSLSWWLIIAAGLVAWCLWIIELGLVGFLGRPMVFFVASFNYFFLLFLFIDTRFFVATNSHLSLLHLWYLRFSGVVSMAGISQATLHGLAIISAGYVGTTVLLGFLLRGRLPIPSRALLRLSLSVSLLVLHILQFDHLAGVIPLQDYLTFRFQFSTRLVPQAIRFQSPVFSPNHDSQALASDRCYKPGKFAWDSSLRSNLVVVLVESWRADLFPVCMPRLYRRAKQGLWLRNHFSQANNTPAALVGLYYGCYPLNFLLQFQRLNPPSFFDFLRESGYQTHFVPGISPQVTQEIEIFHSGFRNHFPSDPTESWPTMTRNAFDKAIELIRE